MERKTKFIMVLLGVLVCAGAASADLISYYRFDNNYLDSSGNENHGTLVGSTDYVDFGNDRFGMSNSALWFAGTGGTGTEYIDTGIAGHANDTGSLTVVTWLWANGNDTNARLVASKTGGGGERDWNLSLETQGGVDHTLRFRVSSTGSDLPGGYTTTSLPQGQWVHVAAVYQDGAGANMKIFFDGVEQGFTEAGTIPESRFNGPETIRIGHRSGLLTQWWDGGIDEFRVYNEALTQAQIQEIMLIPEPATLVLLGLGAVAAFRRKR